MDPRVERMADVLVNYSVAVRPGDWVVIQAHVPAQPLGVACLRAVLRAGGHPSLFLVDEEADEVLLEEGNDEQLQFISPAARARIEQADVQISFQAPTNTRHLSAIAPDRMAVRQSGSRPLMEAFLRRWQEGQLRWTGAQYPTHAAAQDAGMSLREYEDFVFGAGLLDRPDPIAAWQAQAAYQQQLIDWLADKSEIHIVGPGTDLTVNVGDRTWINDDAHYNFPGGEVFTAPHETATTGVISFNFPAVYSGREVDGIRLEFRDGAVVDASADRDEEYLQQMLGLDEGAKVLGEFAIGTNPGIQRFTRNTLFDEKIGGTLHMALGATVPGTGGENVSALHWDMVFNLKAGAQVSADGQVFSRDGEFTVL